MGIRPHALFSYLLQDLQSAISPSAFERIREGESWPGITYREYAALSIRNSFLKKLETGMTAQTKAVALEKFLAANSRCGDWCLPEDRSLLDDLLLGEFRQMLYNFWMVYRDGTYSSLVDHHYDLFDEGAIGPGSGLGADGEDFYTKFFSSRLTGTSSNLYFWYRRYIRGFPTWNGAEELRILDRGEYGVCDGNRLDFVPKNDSESRSICVEPPLNMFVQLGFAAHLRRRLLSFWGINLEVQQFLNRDLARKGSIDGSYITVDLSSASDTISTKMLRWALPADFLRWLLTLRCSRSKLPDGRSVDLEMISTMGNGFTFPLQTILFTAAVLACYKVDGLAAVFPTSGSTGNFGVNGDDIVASSRVSAKLLRLLSLLGFQVNRAKTFVEGPFRESCGGDYFNGRNLRGVYIKRLSGPHDTYAVVNALNRFSARTGIRLSRTVQALLCGVRFNCVPLWANEDSGIRVPFTLLLPRERRLDHNCTLMYNSWEPKPPPKIRIGEWSLKTPRSFKARIFNPLGLETAFLQQSVNGHTISLRPREVLYDWKSRLAPSWDYPSSYDGGLSRLHGSSLTVHSFQEWLSGSRLNTAVYLNLYG